MKAQLNYKASISKVLFTVVFMFSFSANTEAQLNEDWVSRLNKFDMDDKATSMTTDNEGSLYLTGSSVNKDGDKDILTVKFSQSGKLVWEATYAGFGAWNNSDDIANAIAVDDKGNVYVTGYTPVAGNSLDMVLLKYDSKGVEKFVNYYSGSGVWDNCVETGIDVAIDNEGNIIVTGHSNGMTAGNGFDIFAIKYTSEGSFVWINSFDGAQGDDFAKAVRTDYEGNVIIAGVMQGINSGNDYFTAKLSSNGRILWQAKYNGIGGNVLQNEDEVSALEIDKYGNIYVTGFSNGVGSGADFLTIKYDHAGNEKWVSRIDNVPVQKGIINHDESSALKVDESGNVYLTGRTYNEESGSDYFTAKVNEKGETLWERIYDTRDFGVSSEDAAIDLVTDGSGNVFVTGFVTGIGTEETCGSSKDIATLKYSGDGEFQWMQRYNGTDRFELSDDIPVGIALDGNGGIYVAGESMGENTEMDYCLIKYSERFPIGKALHDKAEYKLNDNFPNPFNPTTNISFNIPAASNVRLAIYDMTGREVTMLENKVLQSGSYRYEWNASQFSSGSYFYKITADGFVQTKKMLLIK
jgi:uncharacterized delta-60 repeat protein